MSPELAVALIASASGLLGALLGGATSLATTYFGPKWERQRIEAAEFRERRRAAIIAWIDAAQQVATAAVDKTEDRPKLAAAFNLALSQLTSLLSPEENRVDNFIHGASSYAGTFTRNSGARGLIIANAGRMLIAWHRGALHHSKLRPFKLVHDDGLNRSSIVYVESWSDHADGEVEDGPRR
ncbi:hypothetical protein [Microbacterium sp.]|uniref:hypothetical protein n=1 Tax=Microbacterium sp. TaxID=51671 RepID=UPI00261E296D|nr:hypothetical protein [Microbacterium sp.]